MTKLTTIEINEGGKMRILEFIVEEQILSKDKNCDFSNIISGTKGYLKARFKFSKSWQGYGKVAVFVNLFEEYPVVVKPDNTCEIPPEALTSSKFEVYVAGIKGKGKLTSSSVEIRQERSTV